MSKPEDTSAATQRARDGHRHARQGQLAVADYVGQTAAHAGQAIRRCGLRPGLERSLGCEPELVGRVVAQEPSAGSELARNAMVTLYVGAPGAGPTEQRGDGPLEHAPEPRRAPAAAERDDAAEHVAREPRPTARRRRKPRRAHSTHEAMDAWRAPTPVDEPDFANHMDLAEELAADADVPAPQAQLPEAIEQEGSGDGWREELLACAEDVFAGRRRVSRRRVYPARRTLRRRAVPGAATATSGNRDERRKSA